MDHGKFGGETTKIRLRFRVEGGAKKQHLKYEHIWPGPKPWPSLEDPHDPQQVLLGQNYYI